MQHYSCHYSAKRLVTTWKLKIDFLPFHIPSSALTRAVTSDKTPTNSREIPRGCALLNLVFSETTLSFLVYFTIRTVVGVCMTPLFLG